MTDFADHVKMDVLYGHLELRTWIEYDPVRQRFIGMGMTKHIDRDGNITKIDVSPTGVEAYFEQPDLPWWRRLLP